jgi:hypothetical protein
MRVIRVVKRGTSAMSYRDLLVSTHTGSAAVVAIEFLAAVAGGGISGADRVRGELQGDGPLRGFTLQHDHHRSDAGGDVRRNLHGQRVVRPDDGGCGQGAHEDLRRGRG